MKGSGRAIRAGETACRGKRPIEIKAEYIGESDLLRVQREAVAELPRYERQEARNASFPAGQLAALVYERSLPEDELAIFGYQGCVYSLASGVERRLAPGNGG